MFFGPLGIISLNVILSNIFRFPVSVCLFTLLYLFYQNSVVEKRTKVRDLNKTLEQN